MASELFAAACEKMGSSLQYIPDEDFAPACEKMQYITEDFAPACEQMKRILRDAEQVDVNKIYKYYDYSRKMWRGATALIYAAQSGELELFKLLLDKGADVNAADDYMGATALIYAAQSGELELVKLLLDKLADVNAADKTGATALIYAARSGELELVELLLDKRADVNKEDIEGNTPLYVAIEKKHAHVARKLLTLTDLNVCTCDDKNKLSPLRMAVVKNETEIVWLILAKKCKINESCIEYVGKDRWTLLHVAAYWRSLEVIKLLQRRGGIDPTLLDNDGCTALHRAVKLVSCGNEQKEYWYTAPSSDTVNNILEFEGINVNAKTGKDGRTALHMAAEAGWHTCVEALLNHRAEVNVADKEGQTPLILALKEEYCFEAQTFDDGSRVENEFFDDDKCAESLLEKGADTNVRNERGQTPLDLAFSKGNLKAVRLLLKHGASPPQSLAPVLGMHYARKVDPKDAYDIAKELCNRGAKWDTSCDVEKWQHPPYWIENSQIWHEWFRDFHAKVEVWSEEYEKIKTPSVVRRRCKVCVVGPTECGKTTLVKALTTGKGASVDHGEDGQTLRINRMVLPVESTIPLDVTFWDFVGQDVYQTAHSLFFTEKSVYLLCVNLEKYKEVMKTSDEEGTKTFVEENIFSWVNAISRQHKNPEIVVVGTKRDCIEKEEAIKNDLKGRWKKKFRFEWIYVSSIDDESVTKALRAIRPIISKSAVDFSNAHMLVLDWIEKERDEVEGASIADRLDRMILRQEELRDKLQKATKVSETEDILKLLHEVGEVHLHDSTDKPKAAYAVLDPLLLLDLVKEIGAHESDEDEDLRIGYVRHASLSKFQHWNCLRENHDLIWLLKCLLQQLGLAYPRGKGEMKWDSDLIVPAYWERNTQRAMEDSTEMGGVVAAVSYRFVYKLPPEHSKVVFHRIAARHHNFTERRISKEKIIDTKDINDSKIVATIDLVDSVLNLRVGGLKEQVLGFLIYITNAINEVLKKIDGVSKCVKDEKGEDQPWEDIFEELTMFGSDKQKFLSQCEWVPSNFEEIYDPESTVKNKLLDIEKTVTNTDKTATNTHKIVTSSHKAVTAEDLTKSYPQRWTLMYNNQHGSLQLCMLCDRCQTAANVITFEHSKLLAEYEKPLKAAMAALEFVFDTVSMVNGVRAIVEKILPGMRKKIENDVKIHEMVSLLDLSDGEARVADEKISGQDATWLLRELLKVHDQNFDKDGVSKFSKLKSEFDEGKGQWIWVHLESCQQPEKENDPGNGTKNKEAFDVKLSILDIDIAGWGLEKRVCPFFVSWELKSDQGIIHGEKDLELKQDTTFSIASREQLAKCNFSVDVKRSSKAEAVKKIVVKGSKEGPKKIVGKGLKEGPFLQDGANTVSFEVEVNGEDEKKSVLKVQLEIVH